MTQTKWAHLPNAKHIDWAIDSVKANPEKWNATYDEIWDAAYVAVWDAAWTAEWTAARNAAFDSVRNTANNAAAWGAILALIAYDDCGYMIESEVDEIKILAKLGDQRAILLLPACIVFNETKELV